MPRQRVGGRWGGEGRGRGQNLVITEAKTMDEHLALTLFAPRMGALLLGVFGA
ncbi:MAG: hypothetical protein IH968_03130 [Gemmatimonadetes bacterium]|nr:hypothetical protein [Gemmatimonadota bacterium]